MNDLEVCIGAIEITAENQSVTEVSLSRQMLTIIGRWLGNEERIKTLVSSPSTAPGVFGEQLTEQLFRDGMWTSCHYLLKIYISLLPQI